MGNAHLVCAKCAATSGPRPKAVIVIFWIRLCYLPRQARFAMNKTQFPDCFNGIWEAGTAGEERLG